MRKTIILLFASVLAIAGYAQLPNKLDSLIPVYEKLKEDTVKVDRLLYLATELSAIDTARSGKYGRQAYQLAIKLKDSKGLGNSFNYFGRMFYQVQNYDRSIQCFEKASEYFTKINYTKGIASALNNCGVICNEKGDFNKALEFQQKSMEANKKAKNEDGVGNNYLNMGNTCNLKGSYEEAMNYFLKAESIFAKLEKWESLATAYYNIAYVLYNLNQNDKAIDYVNRSLKLREEKTFNKIGMAYSHVFLASIYSDTASFDHAKATYHYKKVIELCKETGDRLTLLSSYINIAKTYVTQEMPDSAYKPCMHAVELSREMGNQKMETSALYYMGEVLRRLSRDQEAIKYYSDGFKLAEKIGDDAFICNNAQGLALCYAKKGNYKLSYEYLYIYSQKRDLMYNKDNLQTISDMEAKYENEKKQLEIENLNKDKKLQEINLLSKEKENAAKNRLLIFGAIGLLGISVFAFFAYKNFRTTKKQNVIIEQQKLEVENKNKLIVRQKEIVEEKHKEITDSINYAERIQRSFLASEDLLNEYLKDYFVFFHPKDVVSGDFYWAAKMKNDKIALVTADSTGHGVPGAIMSLLNISGLEKATESYSDPSDILNETRKIIINRLKKDGSPDGGKDGMDVSLLVFDFENKLLTYAAANNPVWIVRNNELHEFKPDKMPVGKHERDNVPFSQHSITLEKGDVVYSLTDGLPDQFGGPKGKKFMYKQLKELLTSIATLPMQQQKETLEKTLKDWKGSLEQVDDVCITGVRIS